MMSKLYVITYVMVSMEHFIHSDWLGEMQFPKLHNAEKI